MIYAWTDGSVVGGVWGKKTGEKKPIRNYIGWVVRDGESGAWIAHHSFDMGENESFSGNSAESFAVNSVLRWLLQHGYGDQALVVHSDSQVTIGHLSGAFDIHKENLAKIAFHTKALAAKFPSVDYRWIRRESNRYADFMSKTLQPKFGAKGIPAEEVPADVIAAWH